MHQHTKYTFWPQGVISCCLQGQYYVVPQHRPNKYNLDSENIIKQATIKVKNMEKSENLLNLTVHAVQAF